MKGNTIENGQHLSDEQLADQLAESVQGWRSPAKGGEETPATSAKAAARFWENGGFSLLGKRGSERNPISVDLRGNHLTEQAAKEITDKIAAGQGGMIYVRD